jgi:hypothetical protein
MARDGKAHAMHRTILLAAALAALAAPAEAQEVKHFKAWTAVCDNLKTCSALGYTEQGTDNDAFIRVTRAAGPAAEPVVRLKTALAEGDDGKAPLAWRIGVDGATPAGLEAVAARAGDDDQRRAELTPSQSRALIAALRNGSMLSLKGGKVQIDIGLSGSSAALLWIDDRQGRVGTVTAMAARGARPASAVPAAPPAPVIRPAPAVSQAGLPSKPPKAILASPQRKDCDSDTALSQDPLVARLGPGQVLWGAPCSAGAYNLLSILFVADEAGKAAREITAPDAQAADPNADDELMNIDYDAKTRTLTSFSKARGLGDCGSQASWVWDGKAFRLLDETVMPDCEGVTLDDWPSLYHAVVAP